MQLLRKFVYILLCVLGISVANAAEVPIIAAAADLKFALVEVADHFKQDTGKEVKLTFGSSGNFTQQIAQGAPFEIFLSADENFVFQLADKNLTINRGVLYAIGRLVLFSPNGRLPARPILSPPAGRRPAAKPN